MNHISCLKTHAALGSWRRTAYGAGDPILKVSAHFIENLGRERGQEFHLLLGERILRQSLRRTGEQFLAEIHIQDGARDDLFESFVRHVLLS